MLRRYLTKSRYAAALQCPTKLYYEGKPAYGNQSLEDSFLQALADGGYQVNELAKQYFAGGIVIDEQGYQEAIDGTNELLQHDNVTIYEAAFGFERLFARVDILVKSGNRIDLIEVKARSTSGSDEGVFYNKKGGIRPRWHSILCDVAFQKHVVQSALGKYDVQAFLLLADKQAKAPTEGLNQKFRVAKDEARRRRIVVSERLTEEDLDPPILAKINVDALCQKIYATDFGGYSFVDFLGHLADHYARDQKISPVLSSECASCEYRATDRERQEGKRSGFHECWSEVLAWEDADFLEPTVLDLWNFRKKNQYIAEGRIKLREISKVDLDPKGDGNPGLSTSERQWMQVKKVREQDTTPWIDGESLKQAMDSWRFPLHFIDFETAMVAIPFNKGRRPYEAIAFQYSHHLLHQDGRLVHQGQYLSSTPGHFPNYDFVRSLRRELEQDHGSIFRYGNHENTFLCSIYDQLQADPNPIADRDELLAFIRTVTTSGPRRAEEWEGRRTMIDLLELVKRHYYDPLTNGSNSIKHVLPAILNRSQVVQDKYSSPIYGAVGGIPSHNFQDFIWIKRAEDGKIVDPYLLLPKMLEDVSDHDLLLLEEYAEIRDGGAALTAYSRLQFEEMSAEEREAIKNALLKYCELDTLAMVMLYEAWLDLVG